VISVAFGTLKQRVLDAKILAVLMAALCVTLLLSGSAQATPNIAPDPDFVPVENGNVAGYMVSRAPYITVLNTYLEVYSSSPDIALFIASADLCNGTLAGVNDTRGSALPLTNPTPVSEFKLYEGDSTTVTPLATATGNTRSATTCDNNRSLTQWPADNALKSTSLPITTKRLLGHSDVKVDGRNDLYKFTFKASWIGCLGVPGTVDCGLNAFRLKVLSYNPSPLALNYGSGSDIWVSQDTNQDADKFGISPGQKSAGNYFTYYLPYAANCTQNNNSPAITFYDDDNDGSQPGTQPTRFRFRVESRERGQPWSTASPVWIANSAVSAATPLGVPINMNPPTPPALNYNTAPDANGNIWHVAATSGSKNTIRVSVGVDPGRVYRAIVTGVYYANNLQMQLPYPSVWAAKRCQAEVSPYPSLDPSTNVSNGQNITPEFLVRDNNPGRPVVYDASVRYKRTTWFSNNAASTAPGPGELIKEDLSFQGPVTVPGGGSILLPNTGWNFAANSTWGYMCVALELEAANTDTVTDPARRPRCYPIGAAGKEPSLQVRNGDVRTGGSAPGATACNYSDATFVRGRSGMPANAGSNAQYGVISSGDIDDFGSAGLFASSGGQAYRQLYFGSAGAYTPSSGSDGNFYGNAPGTTHCFPSVDNVFPETTGPVTVPAAGATIADGGGSQRSEHIFTATSGALTINAFALDPNEQVSIRVKAQTCLPGTTYIVRINGDVMRSAATYTSPSQIPWFSVIATSPCIKIVFSDSVTQLYGLYYTLGHMTTCQGGNSQGFDGTDANKYGSNAALRLSSNDCNQAFRIAGATVVGKRLYTYRTFGDGSAGSPAETFDLDPMFVLSDQARGRQSGILTVDKQQELPPRF
jgi:hypothetical protein